MLHVYVCKTALSGKLPEGTIYFDTPESETHKMWGEDVSVPYEDFDVNGWRSAWGKMHRIVSDGSGNLAGCFAKIKRLCGEGKPIGTRETRDNLTAEYIKYILKAIVKSGTKAKDVGKMGKTIADVNTVARKYGIPEAKCKKIFAHAKKIAALQDAEIE